MARRKQATALSTEADPAAGEALQPAAGTANAVLDAPVDEAPPRLWRQNPYPVKTAKLGGYRVVLQESRPDKESRADNDRPTADELWQMQIKFGNGSKDDMPPAPVLEYIKSHTKTVTSREGEEFEVQLFRWNRRDQAWAMAIDYDAPRTSRLMAEDVFAETVKMLGQERGASQERTPL